MKKELIHYGKMWGVGIGILLTLGFNLANRGEQQFSLLAKSFLQGKLYFVQMPGSWADTVLHKDHYYWPLGIFPTATMIPGVWVFEKLNLLFLQGYMNVIFVLLVGLLIYKIAKKLGYTSGDAKYWVLAFLGGTVFLVSALVSWSWNYSQTITTVLLFFILWENLGKKRYFLIGLAIAGISLTRASAALIAIYFVWAIIKDSKRKSADLTLLGIPILGGLAVWGGYNFARFGNWLDQGYAACNVPDFIKNTCNYGLFSWRHIPANVYYFLVKGPDPVFQDNVSHVLRFPYLKADPWGLSIAITSPWLLNLIRMRFPDEASRRWLITVLIIAIPVFTYCGIGFRQMGYRYSLDFLPILFYILMQKMLLQGKLSDSFKKLIIISCFVNFYFFQTVYFII